MPEKMIRLLPPPGCDECSYGEVRYKVHEAGYVDVPEAAVDGLTRVGGFTLAPDQPTQAGDEASRAVAPMANPFDSLGYPDPIE
jgi:hypothetical protein